MKVFEDDDREIRMKDREGKSWRMVEVDKIKYPELNNSDIVRIKSAKTSSQDGVNILEIRPHTNILLFQKDSMIDRKLKNEILDTEIDRVIIDKEEPVGQLIITKDLKSHSNFKKTSLLDLFFPKEYEEFLAKEGKEERKKSSYRGRKRVTLDYEEDKYLLEYSVVGYSPREIKEFVQAHCAYCSDT